MGVNNDFISAYREVSGIRELNGTVFNSQVERVQRLDNDSSACRDKL